MKYASDNLNCTRRESRVRTVRMSVDKDIVKDYLRPLNSADGNLICQMCDNTMPFKVESRDYFEAVEFIKRHKEYEANYLALCPNCAAEYKYACSETDAGLVDKVNDLDEGGDEEDMRIVIHSPINRQIRFTQTHLIDLKEVIKNEPVD